MGAALDVVERFYKSFEANDMDGADELFGDACLTVTPTGEMNKAEHRAFGEAFKSALPDAHMTVVRAVENGDEVFVEGRFQGHHSGDLQTPAGTLPASGNEIDLPFADYFCVRDGQIVDHNTYWDQVSMMTQLGATPSN